MPHIPTLILTFLSLLLVKLTYAQPNYPVPKIIIIGVDGMGAEGVKQGNTPHLDKLMEQGSYTLSANAVMPTKSAPNWASLLMGTMPDMHGVKSNGWRRGDPIPNADCEGEKGIHQTFFSQLKELHPNLRIKVYHDWEGLGKLIEKSVCEEVVSTKTAKKTHRYTLEAIKKKDFDLLFVHFDHVDHALHFSGYLSKRYLKKVEKADTFIGEIVEEVEKVDFPEGYFLIVTADHGGNGRSCGGDTRHEIEIPWIMTGSSVPSQLLDDQEVTIYDMAPTIGFFFELPEHKCWEGKQIQIFE